MAFGFICGRQGDTRAYLSTGSSRLTVYDWACLVNLGLGLPARVVDSCLILCPLSICFAGTCFMCNPFYPPGPFFLVYYWCPPINLINFLTERSVQEDRNRL